MKNIQLITSNDQLIIGKGYWVREKDTKKIDIAKCAMYDSWLFLQTPHSDRFWAMERNSQALSRWDIIGPIPEQEVPNFDLYFK
jgi:hypothetical protein